MTTNGTWMRRGTTIVLDLGGTPPSDLELESGYPTLRRGSTGSYVSKLQRQLGTLGFDPGPIDGIFGSRTDSAVRSFQTSRRIVVDGIVGPRTWSTLLAADGSTPPPTSPTWPTPSPAPGGTLHVTVPFYGYSSSDKAGCFRRCTEMAAAVGVTVGGPELRIQVATREDASGRVTIDPAAAQEGVAYIDSQLAGGRPVCVGVSHAKTSVPNVDAITDHFVLVTTRSKDAAKGFSFYAFHDPARSRVADGGDQNPANRFLPGTDGGLYRPPYSTSSVGLGNVTYYVSMVRRNA